jgi:AraC family transcriptional regulator
MSEYIRDLRLSAAKILLAENKNDIAQIARTVSFKCPASFTSVFRESQGLTPGKYRGLTREDGTRFGMP